MKKPNDFKLSVKELRRLKGMCEAFDNIARIACPANSKDPVEASERLEDIQYILQKFGDEHGL